MAGALKVRVSTAPDIWTVIGGAPKDAIHVGTEPPTDSDVELWWDSDAPAMYLPAPGPALPSRDLQEFGAVDLTGTADATATLNAALAWVYSNHGGIITFPVGTIRIAGQIIVPNTPHLGAGSEAQTQPSMVWRGAGGFSSGQKITGEIGGTILLSTFDGATYNDAKYVTRGLGQWVIEDITFQDTTALADTPFIYTTNTTLKIDRCAFLGATAGVTCAQDAIVLGGKLKPIANNYDDPDSAFQGYGTVIARNYFDRIRRAVYGRSYCNQVQIRDNMMDKDCGTNLAGGACIEFDGSLDPTTPNFGDTCQNNAVTGNYMHGINYVYGVKAIKTSRTFIGFNGFIDAGVAAVALARFEGVNVGGTDYASNFNLVTGNSTHNDVHISEDTMSRGRNYLVGASFTEPSNIGSKIKMIGDAQLVIDTPGTGTTFRVHDGTTNFLRMYNDSNRSWEIAGPLTFVGNAAGTGTTVLTIGNNSRDHDATLAFKAPTGKNNAISFYRAGTHAWRLYDGGGSTILFLRDEINAVMALTFNPGAGVTGRVDFGGAVRIPGTLEHKGASAGFFNTAPIAKPTAVPVTIAGVHAALVSLGLIGA